MKEFKLDGIGTIKCDDDVVMYLVMALDDASAYNKIKAKEDEENGNFSDYGVHTRLQRKFYKAHMEIIEQELNECGL